MKGVKRCNYIGQVSRLCTTRLWRLYSSGDNDSYFIFATANFARNSVVNLQCINTEQAIRVYKRYVVSKFACLSSRYRRNCHRERSHVLKSRFPSDCSCSLGHDDGGETRLDQVPVWTANQHFWRKYSEFLFFLSPSSTPAQKGAHCSRLSPKVLTPRVCKKVELEKKSRSLESPPSTHLETLRAALKVSESESRSRVAPSPRRETRRRNNFLNIANFPGNI